MALGPTLLELISRARADLRAGVPVILEGDSNWLVAPAETVSSARLSEFPRPATLVLSHHRAKTLKVAAYDGELVRITIPSDASDAWLHAMADPSLDLDAPMKGPFRLERDGDANPHRTALKLVKSAQLLPALLICQSDEPPPALTVLPLEDLAATLSDPHEMQPVVSARVPLAVSKAGRVHVFRDETAGEEHYAVEIGRPDRTQPVLARLHSACFTGDVMGSLKCDCGPQLRGALAQMAEEGAGVLLYLNQEGRGIGLANKMRAYSLQDQGFDTVEANHRLGFEDDERDFRIGADLLRRMGFASVRLMTNNPNKIAMMETCGISVSERVPLKVGHTHENAAYLATKAAKSGHML